MNPQPNPELLAELKAYVFAQYIGQKVLEGKSFNPIILTPERLVFKPYLETWLQLRSLSTLTDSEAIEVAKILAAERIKGILWRGEPVFTVLRMHFGTVVKIETARKEFVCTIDICGLWVIDDYVDLKANPIDILSSYQYLQQQSFALPIFYKGVHYSVEELQTLGIYGQFKS